MQLSNRLDPQQTSIGSKGSPSPAAFPMSPAPGATPGTLTKSMNDSKVDLSAVTERMDGGTASIGGGDGSGKLIGTIVPLARIPGYPPAAGGWATAHAAGSLPF